MDVGVSAVALRAEAGPVGEDVELRAVAFGDGGGVVGAAGVDDDDGAGEGFGAVEAGGEVGGFVFGDEGEGEFVHVFVPVGIGGGGVWGV